MKVLLNGEERIWLHPNDAIIPECFPGGTWEIPYLVVSRPARGWRVQLDDIRRSHLSPRSNGLEDDFPFLYWKEQDLLCFAGYKRFYAINGETGKIFASLELEFTDKESLDLLRLLVSVSKDKLIVVSTKVGWLIEQGNKGIRRIVIPGLAESIACEGSGFKISYLDTADVSLGKVVMSVE